MQLEIVQVACIAPGRKEIGETVSTPDQIDEEIRFLMSVLNA
jgi:hypothetical protein